MSDQGSIPSIVPPITWILYSKPGCHLCEGLLDKLRQLPEIAPTLTVRDITTNPQWWQRFHLDIPVLALQTPGDPEMVLPRLSPRDSLERLRFILHSHRQKHLAKMKHI